MRTILALLMFSFTFLPAAAQETDMPAEARERLDYLVGTWDVYDEALDDEGNITKTTHSINVTEYFLGDSVLQTTIIPDEGPIRKTIRFYDKEKEIFYEISVGTEGDLYILSGSLDEYIMSFKSRTLRDGAYPTGRFHHINIEPNSFETYMEVSFDDGKTWNRLNRNSRLVRRTNSE